MQLPEGFIDQFSECDPNPFTGLAEALASESPVSLRYNSGKGMMPPAGSEAIGWCSQGIYLPERPMFTLDPAIHQGLYYVQDASSMFIWHIIKQLTANAAPVRYLDACAAPGGKTTAALDALPAGSTVVANEFVGTRAAVLRENVTKWGNPRCIVTQGATDRFANDGIEFDIIAADVPCSGEGMMRKDAKAVEQWTPQLVDQCAARQREIIDNLWSSLAPGGYFIYSTCTFNRRENEDMVSYMVERYGAETVAVATDGFEGITGALDSDMPCYRFIPGLVRGEGQFMAVVRKSAESASITPSKKERKEKNARKADKPVKAPKEAAEWVNLPEGARLTADADGRVFAEMPSPFDNPRYVPRLEIATVKGRDIIPSHALAMSTMLRTDAFTKIELDRDEALRYLRCEAIALPEGTPRGIVLLTHNSHPLGFAKNVGSRANNLYPKAWRILARQA